jgi:SAM-dependent methyltransferase
MIKCPACDNNSYSLEFTVSREDKYAIMDGRASKPATYRECVSCGLMILNDTHEYEKIYSDGTYYSVNGDAAEFLMERFRKVISLPKGKSDNLERVSRIKDFIASKQTKSILDIGAGMGVFLYQFLDDSWKGSALEPDPNACKHMRNVIKNAKIINGSLDQLFTENKYDLITMNRVLEHIYDQNKTLSSLGKHLNKNGIVYLELPDTESYYKDGPNNEAFGYGHYYVYSPESLKLLADKAGFETLDIQREVEPSGKFTLYGFFKNETSIN